MIAALGAAAGRVSSADGQELQSDKVVGRRGDAQAAPFAIPQLYAAGRRAEAVGRLDGWSEADMKAELVALRNLKNKSGGRLPETVLRAAVMLHTDREAYDRAQAPVVESARECGIEAHAGYARALAGLLVAQSEESREFVRRWLTAMALTSHWDLCLEDVQRWTREGLKWFPRDAQFLLIQGTALEISAALTPKPELFSNPNSRSQGFNQLARRKQELAEAKASLEAAVAADPELHEARLRLGRVLWRLEKLPEARAVLEPLLDRAKDPNVLYRAHLFLGRVLEDAADPEEAIEHYRAALAIDPAAQAAAVALSEALLVTGDDAGGREALGRAVAHAPRREPRDPFLSYHLGRADQAESMLEALRAETLE